MGRPASQTISPFFFFWFFWIPFVFLVTTIHSSESPSIARLTKNNNKYNHWVIIDSADPDWNTFVGKLANLWFFVTDIGLFLFLKWLFLFNFSLSGFSSMVEAFLQYDWLRHILSRWLIIFFLFSIWCRARRTYFLFLDLVVVREC